MFIVKKYIRMGITIFKLFTWGGISSYLQSETFHLGWYIFVFTVGKNVLQNF